MNKFQKITLLISFSAAVLACGLVSTANPTSDQQSIATVVAGTLQAITAAAPSATQPAPTQTPQPAGIPVSFQNVSFVIPNGLASGASSQAIPNNPNDQTNGPWAVAPAHMEFKLDGYNLPAGHFSQILIDVYPAQDYASMYAGAKISLQRLQAALSNPSAPLTNDNLPQVPFFNAASMFVAQVKQIQFKHGTGFRMITEYGQAVGPIANNGTFYHFEGLTSDGKYYVIVVLPIEAPFLQNGMESTSPLPDGGIPFPGYNSTDSATYGNYFKAIADKMDSSSNDTFSPSLNTLDALVQSIDITP